MNTDEQYILEQAMAALNRETGRQIRLLEWAQKEGRRVPDGYIEIENVRYAIEIKKWAQNTNFGALLYQLHQLPERPLLVADYINPRLAARLKDAGIEFIDTAGNAYINQENTYIYARGNKPTLDDETGAVLTDAKGQVTGRNEAGTGRAFTPAGLKVVFELIKAPGLLNHPYREIATQADVALGTVGHVIDDLKLRGTITTKGKGKQLAETEKEWLIETWAEQYPLRLRPRHWVGEFETDDPYWWQRFQVQRFEAQWGGETAAAQLADYLKPERATLYVRGKQALTHIVQAAKLRKATQKGNIEVLTRFWTCHEPQETVHPLLVYADLIATGDPRNLEVARMIYERFLDQHHRQTRPTDG